MASKMEKSRLGSLIKITPFVLEPILERLSTQISSWAQHYGETGVWEDKQEA